MRIFVSGYTHRLFDYIGPETYRKDLGLLLHPRNGYHPHWVSWAGIPWALDNGAFSGFEESLFLRRIKQYKDVPGCKFVVAPDVVADACETLVQFYQWSWIIKSLHYPVAFVLQDGMSGYPMPWSEFDALFIGGSTAYKLSDEARRYAEEAKRRGKWVHMGRVNSMGRLQIAKLFGCDSVDGTGYIRRWSHITNHLPVIRDTTTYEQLPLSGLSVS